MIKKILFFAVLCIVLLMSISCSHNPKGVLFDKAEFLRQKKIWEDFAITSYSFEYSFDGFMPEYITGMVSVNGNNKEAIVLKEKKEDITTDSKYYIDSIEDIFDTLWEEYERAIKTVEAGDYDYIKIDCKYNERYGYPEYVSNPGYGGTKYVENKEGTLVGYRNDDFTFKLTQFSRFWFYLYGGI